MHAGRSTLAFLLALYCLTFCCLTPTARAATFGTVVPFVGGASDLVLDEARNRIYLTNTTQNRVEVYSLAQPRSFRTAIRVDSTPLAAAISRDGRLLFVTCYDASSLNIINLDTATVVSRVTLPAKPEGVAVGADGRVLISTIGTGAGNAQNVLLIYNPAAASSAAISNVTITPPAPTPPILPPPLARPFLSVRSQLRATRNGSRIIGVNLPNFATRAVFVYEVASATVLLSRTVALPSSVIAVSSDGSRFMAGATLFDAATLQVLAQQNVANSPYPFAGNANFNAQINQGGSIFLPNGSAIYSAFDIAPVQNPPARPNVTQLTVTDPNNLLIRLGIQLPENLAGKMEITQDGQTIYALSESGLIIIPIGQLNQSPLAVPESASVLLLSDQCGVTSSSTRARLNITNPGRGRVTATAQLLTTLPAAVGQPAVSALVAPTAAISNAGANPTVDFTFNARNAATLGTTAPAHDYLIQSPEAVNIPPRVRVLQNNRDAEGRGEVIPIDVGISSAEALEDMVFDATRERLYIANSGLNRVEVFDIRTRKLLAPIPVGQLPRALALTPDGSILYVANSTSEAISIVDPDRGVVTGTLRYPPIPFNTALPLVAPAAIAATQRGLLIVMNDGTLWKQVGNDIVPRDVSAVIGANGQNRPNAIPAPRAMATTPEGQYTILASGNGAVYLYDAQVDDFVQARQVFTVAQSGYQGPITAGPGGQFYVLNGTVLNSSLVQISTPAVGPVQPLISAVTAVGRSSYARFSQPLRVGAAVVGSTAIEIVDAVTGVTTRSATALEGPLLQAAVGGRPIPIGSHLIAVDSTATNAYAVTVSGLTIVPLGGILAAERPVINTRGTVNMASYLANFAPNTLISIFGRNLATADKPTTTTLPSILGGVCVTLGGRPLPLLATAAQQINAQIPPDLVPGTYPLVVRNLDRRAPSLTQNITVGRYAPALFVDSAGQPSIYHSNSGKPVNKDNPATRDQRLTMYGVGLGATTGGRVVSASPSPASPLAISGATRVFFGDPRIRQAEVVVEFSGLAPGFIGVYQINVYVPGDRMRGDALQVTVRVGGVDSPSTGPAVPLIPVN